MTSSSESKVKVRHQLNGLEVRVGRYLGLDDDGAVTLPWDFGEAHGQ